jgi:G:T-mismatch repair DNA endonuclease (very short patch repair protein)
MVGMPPKRVRKRRPQMTHAVRNPRTLSKSAAFWDRLARQEPNNAEMTLFGLMCYLGMPYRYTGNAQFLLMGRCPDFVHLTDRKIIELYGERWHKPEEEQQRIDLFARSDYHVLVVWQRELKPKPEDRKRLYQRLTAFEALDDITRTIS